MSELNEAYFNNYLQVHNLDPFDVFDEGDRRLTEKIALLKANPDIKISDFGTRRHFSMQWQNYVLERLIDECPENLVGTSNIALANSLGIKPIGTFAHELPMVYAALADARGEDLRASHNRLLNDWYDQYGQDYSIALTDTFTTDFFFEDFTKEQAQTWKGVRQDSGDPFDFGENLIQFYQDKGINPLTKIVVFSDGLNIKAIIGLQKQFENRIQTVFGWGTDLMNDLGVKPLNIVMKATHVKLPDTNQEADTVKLSDDQGKHIGPSVLLERYQNDFRS